MDEDSRLVYLGCTAGGEGGAKGFFSKIQAFMRVTVCCHIYAICMSVEE